ncbi:MAG: lipocalin, partial [Ktedonobacterales bacterium]|nr:lipocalin [Ktedonobacterales bacterium]
VPPTASTATDTGTPAWVAIVTGIAGLAVGFLGATLLRGQQQPTTA